MKNKETRQQRKYLIDLYLRGSKKYRKLFYISSFLQITSVALMDMVSPFVISIILVDLSQERSIDSIDPYIPYFYALIAIEVTSLIFRRIASYTEERFDAKTRRNLISMVFARLLEHPAYFHQSRFVGTTINLISKVSDCFGKTSGLIVFVFLPLATAVVGTGIILIPRLPAYFVVLVIVSLIYVYIISKLLPQQMKLSADASETSARMYGLMSDGLSNIAAVKSESGEDFESRKVYSVGDEWLILNKAFARRVLIRDSILANSFMRSLRILSVVIAVIYSVIEQNDISNLYLATTLTMAYLMHLWSFSDALYELTVAYGDAAPLVPVLQAEPEVKDIENAPDIGEVQGSIRLDNVSFKYKNAQKHVFENLSLNIEAGKKVGLVGRSGAGKSTIVKLVMRFVDPQEGKIEIDGKDISKVTQESLRDNIAYVAQEPMLFHRSVYHNITYGNSNFTDEDVQDVLIRSHCAEFIDDLPHGLRSVVGERGVNLSGGQRQRIAIARVMLKNAPILILDEATSALDSESEIKVQSAFAELMKERTTIVIAHRLSTLLNMDEIFVFDEGKIIGSGTHNELISQKGLYSALWSHQAGGFLPQ